MPDGDSESLDGEITLERWLAGAATQSVRVPQAALLVETIRATLVSAALRALRLRLNGNRNGNSNGNVGKSSGNVRNLDVNGKGMPHRGRAAEQLTQMRGNWTVTRRHQTQNTQDHQSH